MLRTPLRRSLAALAVLTPLVAIASFSAAVVPTDLQMPGTQPSEVAPLFEPSNCFTCHANYDSAVEPGRNWEGSMMAQATRDPLFWGAMAVAEQTVDGSGDLCLRCHTPTGWLGGRSTPTDGTALNPTTDADGVTCDTCHRMTNPDTSEWYGVQNPPFLAHDESATPVGYNGSGQLSMWDDQFNKLGPYADAVPPHGFFQSTFHRESQLCGSCHDVSNPLVGDLAPGHGAMAPLPGAFDGTPGTPVDGKAAFNNFPYAYGVVERTFSEHQASAFATLPMSGYAGLPSELKQGAMADAYNAAVASNPPTGNYLDGAARGYSCQSCHMKPVNGAGCGLFGVPVRADLPSHDLTGGNYWAPEAIAWLDGQNKLVIGGGLSAGSLTAISDGADRARDNLEAAAGLDVFGGFVRVTNLTGHKLISGYPEGRRMWLNIKWWQGGTMVREDGAYGPMTVDIDGTPTVVETILDLDDPNLIAFEAHHGMSQEWASQLLGYGIPAAAPLGYDRVTGAVTETLGGLAAMAPGTDLETFHFVLNDKVLADNRIPPYGLRYDDAFARNSVPVPDTQYGDPGPGGIYNHWTWEELDIPVGATSATVELLYQPTSWEYIQFLHKSNDGSVTNLADVGDDLLDAWLATGMAAPHVMAGVSWLVGSDTPPFLDQAGSKATPALPAPPVLDGSGPAIPGESVGVSLSGGPPNGSAYLVMGFGLLNAPLKGGTLVPSPDIILEGLPLNDRGNLSIVFPWPLGATPGSVLYAQYWMPTTQGFAASNGLSITTR